MYLGPGRQVGFGQQKMVRKSIPSGGWKLPLWNQTQVQVLAPLIIPYETLGKFFASLSWFSHQ